jgi:CBS domain-containing protein
MNRRYVKDVVKGRTLFSLPSVVSVSVAAKEMRERGCGAVIVMEGGRLAGIFSERDGLFRVIAEGLDPANTPLSAVMTRNVIAVGAGATISDALHRMEDGGFRHLVLVEDGVPVGLVSMRDALGYRQDRNHKAGGVA